jgi:hypothetical protein
VAVVTVMAGIIQHALRDRVGICPALAHGGGEEADDLGVGDGG